MIRLHGFPVSNYFNIVRVALLEKDVDFEIVNAMPNQEGDYLAISPMGKVPCMETPDGPLSETRVMLDYLEEVCDGPALLPADSYERAKVRQAVHGMELYIELQARRLFPGVLFGGTNTQETIDEVKPVMERGMAALSTLVNDGCKPYLMGDAISQADLYATYALGVAQMVAAQVYDWNLLGEIDGLGELLGRLNDRETFAQANAERDAMMAEFLSSRS